MVVHGSERIKIIMDKMEQLYIKSKNENLEAQELNEIIAEIEELKEALGEDDFY